MGKGPVRNDPWDYAGLYARWSSEYREDLAFYRTLGQRAAAQGGPILELCCGTGRLLHALLESGVEVVGLDNSRDQLTAVRRDPRLALALSSGQLRLVQGDMVDFGFGQCFAGIVIAFNSFCYLLDEVSRLRCLRNVADHLLPEGLFALDTDNPITNHPGPEGEFYLDDVLPHFPEEGDSTHVYIGHRKHAEDPRIENLCYRFVVATAQGELVREVQHDMRCDHAPEILRMLEGAGLECTKLVGNFSGKRFEANASPLIVISARRCR